jgi:molybdopterin-guanine dinucleotide biosynthesis protein A
MAKFQTTFYLIIMKSSSVSCIILAGGEGKRFDHADKGLVEYHGQPLIAHVIAALKNQVDDVVISANRNLAQYQKFSPAVIPDAGEKHGPLSGIAAALPACQHDWVLVVPCDMPCLPDNLVAMLSASAANSALVIAEINNHFQLVFLMHKSLLPSLHNEMASGNYRLMQWVNTCSPATVDLSDRAAAFVNINSAHQLIQL